MRLLYTGFYLLLLQGAFAQQSLTYVFRIYAAEVEELHRTAGAANLDFLLDRTPVDTLAADEEPGAYATGHYLRVDAREERLHWFLHTVAAHEVFVQTVAKELVVSVLDEAGRPQLPERVLLDGEPLTPHPADTTYRRKTYRGDWLRVELPGDTLFFEVFERYDRSRLRRRLQRWGQTRAGWIVSSPYRWVRNSYRYFRRGFGYGDWRIYNWPGERLYRRLFGYDRPDFRGYIATNQPLYRRGDTLHLVAYATKHRGRPLRRKLRLSIRHHRDELVDTLLRPVAPGRYVFTTVIGDSARLDQGYYVGLEAVGWRDPRFLSARIHIEDYELDEYRLSIAAPDHFEDHEPVAIDITAGDVNGLPVVGSELEILLTSKDIQSAYTDRFVLPDTLWRQRFAMDDRTAFTVLVPDSLLPPARLALSAELRYTGPSGQQRLERTSFTVVREPAAPRLRLLADSLLLSTSDGEVQAAAELQIQYPGLPLRWQTITLPQRLPINPAAESYTLRYNGKRADLELSDEPDGVNLQTEWRRDTLLLAIDNPYGLPIDWSVRQPGGQFLSGATSARRYRDTLLVDLDRTQLWLNWSYPWAGEVVTAERSIFNAANQLAVRLELPARAYPGQTVPVAVAVADNRGRPQAEVPVAMGSYNARFEKAPYTIPEIRQRGKREPLDWQEFSGRPYSDFRSDSLRARWVAPLQLHDSLFYRMLLPQTALHTEYVPLTRKEQPDTSLAQVSPYLVRRGVRENIHLVYLDHSLVYFAPANGATPYAFVSTPGYHWLTLRTDRAEYRLDNVELRAGHRLVLSLDIDRFAEAEGWVVSARPPQLTFTEQAQLKQQIFVLKSLPSSSPATAYLWQDSTRVFAFGDRRSGTWCGIFTPGGPPLSIHLPDGPRLSARFESGYQYAVETDRDRLYAYDIAPVLADLRLAGRPAKPAFGTSALFPSLLPQSPRRDSTWWVNFDLTLPDRQPGAARLALDGLPDSLYRIVFTRGDSVVRITAPTTRIGHLPPDRYRLWLLYPDQTGQAFSVDLAANRTLFLAIDSAALPPRRTLPAAVLDSLGAEWRTIIRQPDSGRRVIRRYVPGQYTLSGYIRDATGEPLIGASVLIQGTTQGVVTDLDGYYELTTTLPESRLQISYTGFATQEIETRPGEHLEIALEEGLQLDAIVVTGLSSGVSGLRIRGSRSNATAYYVDGIRMGSLPADGISAADELPQYDGPRSAFRDYAAWRPLLLTGRDGKVRFDVTLPDDITAWNSFALATDRQKAGLGLARTQVYLPLQAQLYLPRFLVAGDWSEAIGLAVNRTGAPLNVTPYFGPAGAVRPQEEIPLTTGEELHFSIAAPQERTDSLDYTFEIRSGTFGDGEQRTLPVFRRGTVTTAGWFRTLDTAFAEIDFAFDPAGDSVELRIYGNSLAQLENELAYLRDYPYLCHEQTASRLIALLASARIQLARRSVDPALIEDIRAMLRRLEQGRNADGGWGWWPGGGSSPWISMHVERACRQARRLGWAGVPDSTDTYRLLQSILSARRGTERLAILLFFAEAGLTLDYTAELPPVDTTYRPGRHEWLLRTRIRQLAGMPYQLDTLRAARQSTLTGADYWEEAGRCDYAPYRRTLGNNLLAYQLLRDADQPAAAARARRYLLEGRFAPQSGTLARLGQNTYESALLIHELLPDLLAEDERLRPASAELRTATGRRIAVAETPRLLRLPPGEAERLTWQKSGAGPLFLSASQRRFDPDPPVREQDFQLRTALFQEEQAVDSLRTGIPATLRATVSVRADADYVLIELPIPAGCSYGEKVFGEGRYESHREYRRDRVAIFCTRLPAGVHTFSVPLEPRFRGSYQMNPARAEMMYLPVFNGNDRVREVGIE